MRTATVREPHLREPHAYLAGVLRGDAWLIARSLGLRVADLDFAEAFSGAIREAFGREHPPRLDERGYHLVRTAGQLHVFDCLRDWPCDSGESRAAWLRGLFDSEGNAQLTLKPRGSRSWDRRVAVYSTCAATLDVAEEYLSALGLPHRRSVHPGGPGHLGRRPVWRLRLRPGRETYARFAAAVGSTVGRKQAVLDAIPASYAPDLAVCQREAQARGAATRRAVTDARYDEVVAGIRAAIAGGVPPTMRALAACVPGYWAQQRRHSASRLLEVATSAP